MTLMMESIGTVCGLMIAIIFSIPITFSKRYRAWLASRHKWFSKSRNPRNWKRLHRGFLAWMLAILCLGYGSLGVALTEWAPGVTSFLKWPLLASLVGLLTFTFLYFSVVFFRRPRFMVFKFPEDRPQPDSRQE